MAIIKSFSTSLSILEQYTFLNWNNVIEEIEIKQDIEPTGIENMLSSQSIIGQNEEDEFATFKL